MVDGDIFWPRRPAAFPRLATAMSLGTMTSSFRTLRNGYYSASECPRHVEFFLVNLLRNVVLRKHSPRTRPFPLCHLTGMHGYLAIRADADLLRQRGPALRPPPPWVTVAAQRKSFCFGFSFKFRKTAGCNAGCA